MRVAFVEVAGFRGFKDRMRFDLPAGFVVITGRNGVGKSTICDAIEFALTGTIDKYRTERAAQETLQDYIWWRGAGQPRETFVRIGFVDSDGQTFEVTRTPTHVNMTEQEIEGHLCDVQATPDGALKQLCKTSIIRDEHIAALSLDLTETERFALVKSSLGAIAGPDYGVRARELVVATDDQVKLAERRESDLRTELSTVLTNLTETRDEVEQAGDVNAALSLLEVELGTGESDVGRRLETARAKISDLRITHVRLERLLGATQSLLPRLERVRSAEFTAELDILALESEEAEKALADASDLRGAIEAKIHAEAAADAMASALASLVEHGQHVGLQEGHCPLCNAKLSLSEFEAGIAAAQSRLSTTGVRASQMREERARLESNLRLLESRYNQLRAELKAKSLERDSALSEEREIISALRLLEIEAKGVDLEQLETAITHRQNRLIDLERATIVIEASGAVGRLKDLEQRADQLREQMDMAAGAVARAKAAARAARSIDQAVKRASAEIIDERLATISPLLDELYRRLRPHAEWSNIEYRIRGDVKRYLSLSVGDNLNPQFVFSSGQRRAAGLAFLLSVHLATPWCRWNTLILDDPVQHIDDYRALNLVEVLGAIRRTGRQVICAVEDAALADLICRRLKSEIGAEGRRYDLNLRDPEGAHSVQRHDIPPMPMGTLRSASGIAVAG